MRGFVLLFMASWMSCAYILPATWRAFRGHPDDAAPAITRVLDQRQLEVTEWNQEGQSMLSGWSFDHDGTIHLRERYRIRWEHNEDDQALIIYVRHEGQEKIIGPGGGEWGATFHDSDKELKIMDAITRELEAVYDSMPPAPPPDDAQGARFLPRETRFAFERPFRLAEPIRR